MTQFVRDCRLVRSDKICSTPLPVEYNRAKQNQENNRTPLSFPHGMAPVGNDAVKHAIHCVS